MGKRYGQKDYVEREIDRRLGKHDIDNEYESKKMCKGTKKGNINKDERYSWQIKVEVVPNLSNEPRRVS